MSDATRAKPPTNNPMKAERDRFMAFSFAAADILLELDDAGVVSFVSGAGGTSFESLRSIQVDYAKIDGALVKGSHTSARTRRLLESVMQYCEHAKIDVIAEFIEAEDDEDLVRSFGVGYGQGNRYGKPRMDFRESYGGGRGQ